MPKVFTQPASTVAMTANGGYTPIPIDEKVQLDLGHQQHCEDDCVHEETHNHARCHNSRLRRVLFSAVAFLVSVIIMMSVFCVSHVGVHGDGMMKRDTTTGSSGSTFTDNKLPGAVEAPLKIRYAVPVTCAHAVVDWRVSSALDAVSALPVSKKASSDVPRPASFFVKPSIAFDVGIGPLSALDS
ncbi:hypothetical protein FISHEDRAFT_72319 [Fistulina hepatica ATCC 64428]|uniref:Transmembrane protein n=1 Tax=Fistulina hepatica ATCC 64428 TaxID=1128425 RepID=A0A0D7AEB5_9AGAR|nr:hypothetical protein FISHEDRAFT_72319 [Fistulina hepatica ATCC 64428]